MIQQLIYTCCLVSAPKPIATLHPLSSCTFISPSALQIRPYSALKSLSAILYFLNRFFISRSISVCRLLASGLKNQLRTSGSSKTVLFQKIHILEATLSKKTIINGWSHHDRR